MELYLDANATTPVSPVARAAALAAMGERFANPSSVHGAGLRARALLDGVRETARRVLGAPGGRVLFTSGATEGIQTAVLSALVSLRTRRQAGEPVAPLLLYGATEHKAVPAALKHWDQLLGLGLEIQAIPVGGDGRHDLAWLRRHAQRAGLVCTMAANNETGVISDLEGIEQALVGSPALWLVDGVQALGKLELALGRRRIDYAPFSGHKLYAPKGVGLLYVRDGAPFTPLITGGGQEDDWRAGTENMSGIAALGAVLKALEDHDGFKSVATLAGYRDKLAGALGDAFPGVVFNSSEAISLATTLNFSVPGLSAKMLLDLFDAADVRVSGGSACSAAKAKPSEVLEAMGLPAWRTASAVRLSFGAMDDEAFIDEACTRIRDCGQALRASCLSGDAPDAPQAPDLVTRYIVDGACCYLICPPGSDGCVVVDPLPDVAQTVARLLNCQGRRLVAVLDTHSHGDHASAAAALWSAAGQSPRRDVVLDELGWPVDRVTLDLGAYRLERLATPGHTADATAFLLYRGDRLTIAFVGDTVLPGALGRSDFAQSAPERFASTLRLIARDVGLHTLLLPGHDYDDRHATTLAVECESQPSVAAVIEGRVDDADFAHAKAELERDLALTRYDTLACGARAAPCARRIDVAIARGELEALLHAHPLAVLVDVRERYEQRVHGQPLFEAHPAQCVPLSGVVNAIDGWRQLPDDRPLVFYCRSGNRSAQVARTLRQLGRANAWSLAGGLALHEGAGRPDRRGSADDIDDDGVRRAQA